MFPASTRHLARFSAALAAACSLVAPATAGLINVDFNDATSNLGGPTVTFAGAAAVGTAGDKWNGLNLADGWGDTNTTKAYPALVDSSGNVTTTGLLLTGERRAYPVAPAPPVTGPYDALLQDYVSASPNFAFSGLDNGPYDVYVYSGNGPNGTSSGSVQVNGGTKKFFDPTLTGAALVADRDYLQFSTTVTDGTLTINGVDQAADPLGNFFAGFQLKSSWPTALWTSTGTGDWGSGGNWTPDSGASVPPDSVAASATFKSAGASNSVDLGASDRTVGSLLFNNANVASVTLASSQGKSLLLDNGSNAPNVTVHGSHVIGAGMKLNGDLTVTSGLASDALALNGAISDAGANHGLANSGAGTLVLRGTNTYTGITRVNHGTLQVAKKAALYNGTSSSWLPQNLIVESGATLICNVGGTGEFLITEFITLLNSTHLGASTANTGLKSGSYVGLDTGNYVPGSLTPGVIFTNPASGSPVGFVKNGAGTLYIGGSNRINTYSGGTIVNGGTLALGDASSTGNSVIRGILTINSGGKVTFGNCLGNNGTADVRLSQINIRGGTLDRIPSSPANSNMGGITLNLRGGTLAHTGTGYHEFATINGGNVLNVEESANSSVISGTVQFDSQQLITVANGAAAIDLLVSGKIQGSYSFIKDGPGVMALTNANTYAGVTTVNAGTLLANNTSGSGTSTGAVSVASGASVGGTGTITGALNVAGTLAPGTPGHSLATGPVNLLAGSTFRCDMDSGATTASGTSMLHVANYGVSADLTLSGAVSLVLNDIASSKKSFPVGTTFSLIHYTGTWNGGFFAYGGTELSNGHDFTAGLNNWKIDYDASVPGSNFTGVPTVGTDKFINLTAIPFAGSATVGNLDVTAITATTATLRGVVTAIGNDAPSITIFYGLTNGVTTPERWQHSVALSGTWNGAFTLDLSSLTLLTNYYFTVRATNSAGDSWVIPATAFKTTAVPPAVVTTAASAITGTTATVGATVTSNGGENPAVTVYYGTSDGGTNPAAWSNSIALGTGGGALSGSLAGLAPFPANYYFRAYAANSGGGAWAPVSLGFSTLPVSLPAVDSHSTDGVTGTTAVLHGSITQTGNDVPVVTLFYGTTDGGTNPNAWNSSITLGILNGDFTRFISGLSLNTPYFFRWRAVNAAGSTWSTAAGTFTTTSQVPSTIVINEIHFNGLDNTIHNEFIEIFNSGPSATSLANWRISGGIDYLFPAGTTIAPNGFVIVASDPATILAKYGKSALGPWTGSLSSDGETVRLRDSTNVIIDEVDYKVGFPWPVAAGGDGASMEKIHPGLDGSLGASWRSSVIPADDATTDTVTPGAVNLQFAANAPPAIRQVQHLPQQPTSQDPIVITAKVTDPQGVTSVTLSYQVVTPGNYIPRYLSNVPSGNTIAQEARTLNPAYELASNWTTVAMNDNGTAGDAQYGDSIWTVVIPPKANRTLLRYRITVTDSLGTSVRVPYADDPAGNFACYTYNGVPAYGDTSAAVLQTLPVYQLITKASDWADCVAYDGSKQLGWSDPSRFYYNWNGTFVYDGVVYDNIRYRTRGANGRYQGAGKRSMRFKFNRGSYLAARDQLGNFYPEKWQTVTTAKGAENSGTLTYGLNEWMNLRMWNAYGVPAPFAHYAHWRNVTTAAEQADNYHGDFQGLILIQEDYDSRFLKAHNMDKGNLYKLLNETDVALAEQRYQAPYGAKNGADHDWVYSLNSSTPAATVSANVNVDKWDHYHAICQAVRHYDYWPNCDKNMCFYFEPVYTAQNGYRGKLWILPYDHDASWGPSWNSGIDNVYDAFFSAGSGGSNATFWPGYFNTIRECRTLLYQPEQINPLLDEIASWILPFQKADDTRWKNGPADAGSYSGWGGPGSVSIANLVLAMKDFAFGGGGRGTFMDQLGNSNGEDATKYPATPTITFVGTAGYHVDDLRFGTSTFSDPQGAGTFGALQWRVAEVNASATFTPGVKRLLEVEANYQSDEITTFANTFTFPSWACEAGKHYRARVRHKDNTGRWSNWSAPAEFTATVAPPPTNTLIHYWNFNDVSSLTNQLIANWSIGGATLSVVGTCQSDTGEKFAAVNARGGDPAGAHLRVNNPLTAGTMVTVKIPTTGFEKVYVKYEGRRSTQGSATQYVSYTLDGVNYTPFATLTVNDEKVQVPILTLDFSAVTGANNNPQFAIRFTFAQGAGGVAGNNRFDNFTVEASARAGQSVPLLLPGGDAAWNLPANWANGAVPNAAGALALIAAPAAANRAVTLTAPITVGDLEIDNSASAFRNQITCVAGSPLTFNGGAQPARLAVAGSSTGYIEFDLPDAVNLATNLDLNVSNILGDPAYGALRLRGTWTGTGGLIKQGLGCASLTGLGKTFSGPVLVEQGVLQVTQPAAPGQSSGVTVQNGGQLRLTSSNDVNGARIYTFGGSVVLAGSGRGAEIPNSDNYGVLGALRYNPDIPGVNRAIVTNPVNLSANACIHNDGATNTLELSGPVTGNGSLTKTGDGPLVLSAATNSYTGETIVASGILSISNPNFSATSKVTLGAASGSSAVLDLPNSVTYAVGTLVIDGVTMADDLYDSTNSGGAITGPGKIQVGNPGKPMIALEQGTTLANGGSKNFGSVLLGSCTTLSFTIRNSGDAALVLEPLTTDSGDFRVTQPVDNSIAAGGSVAFTVTFTPTVMGGRSSVIHITSNDPSNSPFNIITAGVGITDYSQWQMAFLGDMSPGADPDGDGMTNLQEYAFGLNPNNPLSHNPITVPFDRTTGTFSYTRRDPSLTGFTYNICYSVDDLSSWTVDENAVQTPGPATNGVQTVTVKLGDNLRSMPQLFVRAQATQP